MKKNKLNDYFLIISILTFITIFIFIVQESYSNLMKPINNAQSSNVLDPIDPNLDISLLDQIEKRENYFSSIEEASSSSVSSTPIIDESLENGESLINNE